MPTDITPKGGLYVLRLSDSHYYGGRSANCDHRWKEHLRDLQAGTHYNKRMQAVYNLHKRFEPEVVTPWTEGLDLREVEQRWLDANFRKPGCVNLVRTSDGGGGEWSDASKKKMSQTLTSRPDLIAKARESMSKNRDKRLWTPEARQKLRERNIARRGVPQKPEHVSQRAESNRGRKNTPETIKLMSESAKVRSKAHPTVHGQGTRELISTQQRGRVWVHSATVNQRVWPTEATDLLAQGWFPGRLPNKAR